MLACDREGRLQMKRTWSWVLLGRDECVEAKSGAYTMWRLRNLRGTKLRSAGGCFSDNDMMVVLLSFSPSSFLPSFFFLLLLSPLLSEMSVRLAILSRNLREWKSSQYLLACSSVHNSHCIVSRARCCRLVYYLRASKSSQDRVIVVQQPSSEYGSHRTNE